MPEGFKQSTGRPKITSWHAVEKEVKQMGKTLRDIKVMTKDQQM